MAHGAIWCTLLACRAELLPVMIECFPEESSRLPSCLRNEVVMERTPLLPLPEGMLIDQIEIAKDGLVITAVATHPTSCCPLCSVVSSSIQSHYHRRVRDAPCAGQRVQLLLKVRKFSCRNPCCERKVTTRAAPSLCGTVGEDDCWAR